MSQFICSVSQEVSLHIYKGYEVYVTREGSVAQICICVESQQSFLYSSTNSMRYR